MLSFSPFYFQEWFFHQLFIFLICFFLSELLFAEIVSFFWNSVLPLVIVYNDLIRHSLLPILSFGRCFQVLSLPKVNHGCFNAASMFFLILMFIYLSQRYDLLWNSNLLLHFDHHKRLPSTIIFFTWSWNPLQRRCFL